MEINQKTDLSSRVQALLVEALQIPADWVTPDLAFGDLPQWDSMGHMEVMMHLEEKLGVEINTDTIAELVNVPAICAYIVAHNHTE